MSHCILGPRPTLKFTFIVLVLCLSCLWILFVERTRCFNQIKSQFFNFAYMMHNTTFRELFVWNFHRDLVKKQTSRQGIDWYNISKWITYEYTVKYLGMLALELGRFLPQSMNSTITLFTWCDNMLFILHKTMIWCHFITSQCQVGYFRIHVTYEYTVTLWTECYIDDFLKCSLPLLWFILTV